MRLWHIYIGFSLCGLAVLIAGIAVTWVEGADDFGILLLTEYWIALCLAAGLLLLLARALRRLASRLVKPS
jgi:membrane protein implicated in regulation of membrane protease activity